jgi:hypothetical protein
VKIADSRNAPFWTGTLLFFAAIVVLTYFPVLAGKVPLPNDMVFRYPPWDAIAKPALPPFATIGDLITFVYPLRLFGSRTVKQAQLPLWNPYFSSGAPFVADSQSAVFYPLNLLSYVLPLPIAWSAGLMIRLFLAATFMSLFMRAMGASRTGAILSGIVFGWCGFNTSWQGFPMGDSAIWLPLMCYAVQRLYRSPDSAGLALAAMAFAMPVLAGHPETAAHASLTAIVFAVILRVLPAEENDESRRFFVRMSVAGFLAVGVAAIQVLPTVEWLSQAGQYLNTVWATLPLSQALGIVSRDIHYSPNSAGIHVPEAASYVGLMTLLVAPLAFLHDRKRYAVALAIITVLAFMTAFSVQPLRWIVSHIPLLKGIKNNRVILVESFGLAALAGLGITALQEKSRQFKRSKGALLLAIAFVLTFGMVYTLQRKTTFRVSVMRRPSFSRVLLVASAVPLVTALFGRMRGRSFSIAICGIAAFDLVTFSYGYTSFAERRNIFPTAPVFDFLKAHTDPGAYRVVALSGAYPVNSPSVYGLAAADGYDIPLQRMWYFNNGLRVDGETALQFTEDRILAAQDRRLDLLNVKYLVGKVSNPDFERMRQEERFPIVFEAGGLAVFENKTVLPRAFAVPVSGTEVLSDLSAQIARLTDRSFDPERSVIAASRPVAAASTDALVQAFTSDVETIEHDVNAVAYRTQTSQPAVLVVSQSYYPGWYATVDGKPAAVFAADIALTGVVVPAGTHDVRLFLNPLSFRVGMMLTAIAVLCVAGLLVSGLLPRYELPLLQPLAVGTGVAAVAAVALIVSANPELGGSNATDDGAARTQSVRLQFSNELGLATLPALKTQTGYAKLEMDSSDVTAIAMLHYREGKIGSEAVLPSDVPITSGSIPFQLDGNYRTAVVFVNGGNGDANIDLAVDAGSVQRRITIPAGDKLSDFLNAAPFQVSGTRGTLTWQSDVPVFVSVIETFRDATHPFLMAPLRVANSGRLNKEPLYVPFVSDGHDAGELILVNPTQNSLSGEHIYYSANGERLGQHPYSIAPHTTMRVPMKGLRSGWIDVVPGARDPAPEAMLLLLPDGSETANLVSIQATPAITDTTLRLSASPAVPVRIVAANPRAVATSITLGSEVPISEFGMVTVPVSSAGTVRVHSSTPIALAVLRSRVVTGKEYVTSSYPTKLSSATVLPHFAAGGLFRAEFHLFAPEKMTVRGVLQFFDDDGKPMKIAIGNQ